MKQQEMAIESRRTLSFSLLRSSPVPLTPETPATPPQDTRGGFQLEPRELHKIDDVQAACLRPCSLMGVWAAQGSELTKAQIELSKG